jgi:signal transduction histidine kinase
MDRLIGDLLDASTIEAGRLSLETAVQPVDQIVRDALEALEAPAAQKQVKLETSGACELGVFCDRGRMLQVFSNIVGNAIKFTPEGGSIMIRVEPRESEVWFFITDTGPGIPEDQLPRLFDRFWQAKRTARLGTGLGLTIAKGIIEAQDGRIGVESQLGVGSTFFFTLPRASPASSAAEANGGDRPELRSPDHAPK